MAELQPLTIHPLTPNRWDDLEDLFGPHRGANSGCWCMWLRIRGIDFDAMDRQARKESFRAIVQAGPPPGLLAYQGGVAVGWCAITPRSNLIRFQSAKASRPVEEPGGPSQARIYALSCFFVRPSHRRLGVSAALASAAIDYARGEGASAVEACPLDPQRPLVRGEGFVGLMPVFVSLGFLEVARRSPYRPLMRLAVPHRE